jgi:uncharacterized protein with beta-barrel porin domain
LDGFSETGGTTALTFDGQNVNDATVRIGADISSLIPINRGSIKPFGKFEYNASVSDTSQQFITVLKALTTQQTLIRQM